LKLVIQYTTGTYDDPVQEHNYCVYSDTKDHFAKAFRAAFEKWNILWQERIVLLRNLFDARDTRDPRKITPAEGAWQEYNDSGRSHDAFYLVIDGCRFALPDNNWEEKDGGYTLSYLPNIYTLDEWFEANKPERVVQ
jgi:hypothetical protein